MQEWGKGFEIVNTYRHYRQTFVFSQPLIHHHRVLDIMEPKLTPNGVSLLTRNFTGFPSSVLATLDQSIMVKIEEYMDIISQGVLVSDDTGASTFVKVLMHTQNSLFLRISPSNSSSKTMEESGKRAGASEMKIVVDEKIVICDFFSQHTL